MIEFFAIFRVCLKDFELDQMTDKYSQELINISNLFELSEFIYQRKTQSKYVIDSIKELLDPKNNFQQIILVDKIPQINIKAIENLLNEKIEKHKLKILIPELDIYIPSDDNDQSVGYAIILYDGLKNLNLNDLEENEEEKEQEPAPPVERLWFCPRCTLLNPDQTDVCEVCEEPKPANPVYPEEEKKVETKQEIDKKSVPYRIKKFSDDLLESFERLTPDKRIKVISYHEENLEKVKESTEILEFLMVRTTSEKFQERLKEVCIEIQKQHNSIEGDLYDQLNGMETVELFETLQKYGYDLWLEKVNISENEEIYLLPKYDHVVFQNFLQEINNEMEDFNNYHPKNFRIEFKNKLTGLSLDQDELLKKIRYDESRDFYFKAMKLTQYSNFQLKCVLAVIYKLNFLLHQSYEYLIIPCSQNIFISNQIPLDLGTLLMYSRDYFCNIFKIHACEQLLQKSAEQRDSAPKIIIERITKEKEILDEIPEKKKSQFEKKSIFLQAFNQLCVMNAKQLRPPKPRGNDSYISFEVQFKGEHVMGESGPYRQFFADIVGELQQDYQGEQNKIDLLIPTPNRLAELGDFKDKFTINPSQKSSYHLQQYEFLGLLMGCAFRTEIFLSLDLPQIFWKKLTGEKIFEQDIEELDRAVLELVRFVKDCSEEDFEESIFETYCTFLSDRTQHELIPGGKNIKVTYENRNDFIQKLLKIRLAEADPQIQAIRKGFSKIVPLVVLSFLSAKDLEKKVCGEKEVDFKMLKNHTKYSGGLEENSQLIKNFWEVLFEMSENDKLLFVKFCWGQERLPQSLQGYESRSTRFMIKPSQYSGNQDGILPRADTCFFNFELPNYSCKEIMRDKILLAIHTDCDSMNAEEKIEEQNNQNQSYEMYEHHDYF